MPRVSQEVPIKTEPCLTCGSSCNLVAKDQMQCSACGAIFLWTSGRKWRVIKNSDQTRLSKVLVRNVNRKRKGAFRTRS